MINTTFEDRKLSVTFTLRVMEIVKRMRIRPMPRISEVPWGLSLAAGIMIAIMSFNPHISISEPIDVPVEANMLAAGTIPVDIMTASQLLIGTGK